MNNVQITAIPPGRVSTLTRPEIRVYAPEGASLTLSLVQGGRVLSQREYPLPPAGTTIWPEVAGVVGDLTFAVTIADSHGKALAEQSIAYEILDTGRRSTTLIDGCWISLYHWSEDEARWFNPDLKKLTAADWRDHILAMERVGIKNVMIQNVFDSEEYVFQHEQTAQDYYGQAFYPSRLFPDHRKELACDDPIEAVLAAADEADMHVFLGVGLFAWFDFSPQSLIWHKLVTTELWERYGHHRSLYSWYISEEMLGSLYYDYSAYIPGETWRDVAAFFADYSAFVRELTPTMPVSLATNNQRLHEYGDEWRQILAGIDILFPFMFARDLENLNISQIQQLCDETKTRMWVDMEMFAFPFDEGLKPKTCDELIREIEIYDDVEQIFGYQFTGIMNDPDSPFNLGGEAAKQLYRDYQRHYREVRRAALGQ